jgi:DNA-formamidopyrimidine glycosylase
MPELVEVESARRWLLSVCRGATVVEVNLKETGGGPRDGLFDDIVFEEVSDPAVRAQLINSCSVDRKSRLTTLSENTQNSDESWYKVALLGRKVNEVHRKGKQLWWSFEDFGASNLVTTNNEKAINDDWKVLFHFGMTGSFVIKDRPIPTYKSFKVESSAWPPKFTKIEIIFDNGIRVAFCDPRRLGRIRIRCNVEDSSPVKDLARDPVLQPLPTDEELRNMLASYSTSIKAILLDQEKVFCGIGNYLADEILYQSGIHPETRACDINVEGCSQLLTKMQYILTTAISADANYEEFPKDWLFHYRWDKVKANGGEKLKMPDGSLIHFETHGGRTSAIVPSKQPKNGYYWLKISAHVKSTKKALVSSSNCGKSGSQINVAQNPQSSISSLREVSTTEDSNFEMVKIAKTKSTTKKRKVEEPVKDITVIENNSSFSNCDNGVVQTQLRRSKRKSSSSIS